jgi:rare lipoprotein A
MEPWSVGGGDRARAGLLLALLGLSCASGDVKHRPKPADERRVEELRRRDRPYVERGIASWYGEPFHGRRTANGETYDMHAVSAAHRFLPFGTWVLVRNLDNGRELEVRINDRGPFVRKRIVDLSRAGAVALDMVRAGVANVELRVVRWPGSGPPAAVATGGELWLQAGAFQDEPRARRLAEQLRRFDARFTVYTDGGWHRVQARGLSIQEAERLRERLLRRGYKAVVRRAGESAL